MWQCGSISTEEIGRSVPGESAGLSRNGTSAASLNKRSARPFLASPALIRPRTGAADGPKLSADGFLSTEEKRSSVPGGSAGSSLNGTYAASVNKRAALPFLASPALIRPRTGAADGPKLGADGFLSTEEIRSSVRSGSAGSSLNGTGAARLNNSAGLSFIAGPAPIRQTTGAAAGPKLSAVGSKSLEEIGMSVPGHETGLSDCGDRPASIGLASIGTALGTAIGTATGIAIGISMFIRIVAGTAWVPKLT
jgi:hypothetical protein